MSCRERVSNGCSMSDRIPELRLKRHRPGFLVTGAQKAGTTWLNNVLSSHEELWLPPVKELHYFDNHEKYKPESRIEVSESREMPMSIRRYLCRKHGPMVKLLANGKSPYPQRWLDGYSAYVR